MSSTGRVQRWARQGRTLTVAGVAAVLLSAGLLWLQQAGIGLVAGLALLCVALPNAVLPLIDVPPADPGAAGAAVHVWLTTDHG